MKEMLLVAKHQKVFYVAVVFAASMQARRGKVTFASLVSGTNDERTLSQSIMQGTFKAWYSRGVLEPPHPSPLTPHPSLSFPSTKSQKAKTMDYDYILPYVWVMRSSGNPSLTETFATILNTLT